jgi:hypothetical protein
MNKNQSYKLNQQETPVLPDDLIWGISGPGKYQSDSSQRHFLSE